MTDRFVLNTSALDNIASSEAMQDAMRELAEAAAEEAKRIARDEAFLSGDYYDSIEVEVGEEDGHALARINAKDFKAGWVEFGSQHNPAHAPLRRGCEQTGLEVTSE